MRGLLPLLLLALALQPLAAHAQEESGDPSVDGPSETDEDEAAPGEETPPPAPPRVDSLGRPFPSPEVLERAKAQTIGGIVMAGVGGAALGTGLFLGSSVARGETEIGTPAETGVVLGVAFGSGVLLLAAGIPTASTGTFTTKQMNRTIKGAEKVPRTVANEMKYWDFYAQRQVGQAMTVGGGGAVLMGVVATGAAVAIVGTEFYKPEIWAAVGGTFGGGAGLIVAGILLQRDADQRMDALAKEVDPYYREASLPPRLRPFRIDSRDLIPLPTGMGISWAFRF